MELLHQFLTEFELKLFHISISQALVIPKDFLGKLWASDKLTTENRSRCKVRLGLDGRGEMPAKRRTPEQVISKLCEAEAATAQGSTVAKASRQIGVAQQTFYRRRNE